MTKSELIKILETVDDDTVVCYSNFYDDCFEEVDRIKVFNDREYDNASGETKMGKVVVLIG